MSSSSRKRCRSSSFVEQPLPSPPASLSPSIPSSSNIPLTSISSTAQQFVDTQHDAPASSGLSLPLYQPFHRSARTMNDVSRDREPVIDVLSLCNLRDSAYTLFEAQVKGKSMRLDARRGNNQISARTNQQSENQKKSSSSSASSTRRCTLSHKAAKSRGLYLPDPSLQFSDCLALHELWLQYIEDVIPSTLPTRQQASRLVQADLHGAFLRVVRSRVGSYVGLEGIVIQETEQTFRVVASDGRMRCLMKGESVFEVQLPHVKCFLHGQHLLYRPGMRSKVKVKPKLSLQLP